MRLRLRLLLLCRSLMRPFSSTAYARATRLALLLCTLAMGLSGQTAGAQPFSPSLDLSTLNGANGCVPNGIDPVDHSGYSVSAAGDVNGDRFGDGLIGAPGADPNGNSQAGESYIVFGRSENVSPTSPLNTNADTDSGDDDFAAVETDGFGNWVVVWRSTDDLAGTIGADYDILMARSSDNGSTWTTPAALNTNAPTDAAEDSWPPTIATDGSGVWLAAGAADSDLGGMIGGDRDIVFAR